MIFTKHTHPLTGEEINTRETINETVDTSRLDILRAINNLSLPTDQCDIATRAETSEKTTKDHLSGLLNHGLTKTYRGQYEPTAGGKLLLEAVEDCLTTIPESVLVELTRSKNSLVILLALDDEYQDIRELRQTMSEPPSKPTVKRHLGWLTEHGWTVENSRAYRITTAGKDALLAYDDLSVAVGQIIEKAEWLQRLPLEDATVPVQELTDAVVIASDTTSTSNVLSVAFRLCDIRVSQFRCVCSIYNPVLFYAYKTMLDFGVEAEAILDWESYVKSEQDPKTEFAARSKYDHYQPLYLDDSHTLGIGLYDERKVAVGAYNERGEGKHIAMIVSENPRIVEWGENLYNSYREIAHCPRENPPNIDGGFDGREW